MALIFLVTLVIGVCPAGAQLFSSDKVVKVTSLLSRDKLHPNEKFQVAVILDIQKGYHINAHKPSLAYLKPTVLQLKTLPGWTLSAPRYPKETVKRFAFAETSLAVYEGRQPIFVTMVTRNVKPGKYTITGELRVQACDDNSCLMPATVKVAIPVQVVPVHTKTKAINQTIFHPTASKGKGVALPTQENIRAGPENVGGAQPDDLSQRLRESGFLLTLVYVFLGGLALNLTPCVYPLIPITIGYFGGQSEGRASRTFLLAACYVLGIAITYSTLGVISGMAGTLMGSLLQKPAVLLFVAAILVALALSMFGLYEIQPPRFISQRAQAKKGCVGALAMGLLVGLVAAPCLAPVLGWLLTYVATTRNPAMGFWMFFTLAIGMGLPYLFLGTFAGAVQSLPRSGVWLIWVKKVFGTLLLAATLYVLNPLLPDFLERIFLVSFLGISGLYLGWLESSGKGLPKFLFAKWVLGILTIGAAIWLAVVTATGSKGVEWQPFDDALLQQAVARSQPVIIDVWAEWCFDCRQLDARTFRDPRVVQQLQGFVRLKADLTNEKSPFVEELRKRFNVLGPPTIILLDASGHERTDLRLTGFETPDKFLKRLTAMTSESRTE